MDEQLLPTPLPHTELPPWVLDPTEREKLYAHLFIMDFNKKLFDNFLNFATKEINSAAFYISDYLTYLDNHRSFLNIAKETAENLITDILQKYLSSDYWVLARDTASNSLYVAFKEKNKKVYSLLSQEIMSYIQTQYVTIKTEQKEISFPSLSEITNKFDLNKNDISALFHIIPSTEICDFTINSKMVTNKINGFEISGPNFSESILVPPQKDYFSLIYNFYLPVVRDFLTAMLKRGQLEFIAKKLSNDGESPIPPDDIKKLFIELLSDFKELKANNSNQILQKLSKPRYSEIFQLFYQLLEARTTTLPLPNNFVSVVFLSNFLLNIKKAFEKDKKANESFNSEKTSIFKNLINKAKVGGELATITFDSILDFPCSSGETTLRLKYSQTQYQLKSFIPTGVEPGVEIPGFPSVYDQIPFCITFNNLEQPRFLHRWIFALLFKQEIEREHQRLVTRLADKWLANINFVKSQKKEISIDKQDITPFTLELINMILTWRTMYSVEELSPILFPSQQVLFSKISDPEEAASASWVCKTSDEAKKFILNYIEPLFRVSNQNSPQLKPFQDIFKLTFREIINSNEQLLIQVSPVAKFFYIIRTFFSKLSKDDTKELKKVTLSKSKNRTTVRSYNSSFDELVRKAANDPNLKGKIVQGLIETYFIEPDITTIKTTQFKELLSDRIINYNRGANYIWLSDNAVSVLQPNGSASYITARRNHLQSSVNKLRANIQNELVIVSDDEKETLAPRETLLTQL